MRKLLLCPVGGERLLISRRPLRPSYATLGPETTGTHKASAQTGDNHMLCTCVAV